MHQHEPGEHALEQHADEAAEQQPAKREADMLGDAVEAGAVRERQHPGDAAIVKRGSAARKMPMTIIAMTLVTAPIALPTALVSRPTEPSSCCTEVVGGPLGTGRATRRIHHAVELGGDDNPQRFGLGRDGRAGEPEHPADEAEAERAGEQQPPAAPDRQEPAEQARAAVEKTAKIDAANDQQQRLGEDDDRRR